MMSKAETDSERSSRTDADEVKDSVRCGCPRIFERLLRILRDVADSAGHVDGDEVTIPPRLEVRLVSPLVNLLASVSNLLR
jgi:hypothetical protein